MGSGDRLKTEILDLEFLDTDGVIASFLLLGDGSAALVETGPSTCLESLTAGLKDHGVAPEDVHGVFLTHIHLDHAGASGNLAGLLPNATFYVHEVGYPHVVDPSKLLVSAERLYGDRMEELWGEVRPVPEERLVSLSGGEELEAAGGSLVAHYTPGHAYHHLAYHEPESGMLFAGDVAGVRVPGNDHVRPPTPPPEIDVEAWRASIAKMREVAPAAVCPTHFGRFDDVGRHLDELERRLEDWLRLAEEREEAGWEGVAAALRSEADAALLASNPEPGDGERYELAGNYEMLAAGLLRYVRKRREKREGS